MKQLFILFLLVAAISSNSNAQKINISKLPAAVKAAFTKQYPGVIAKWDKEDGKYEASFKQNGSDQSVLYEVNGSTAESEMDIKIAALPVAAINYVKEHYKGKTIKEASKITTADGTVNYEANISGKDLIFDAAGKFIKEIKE
jgi:hypothetical protein